MFFLGGFLCFMAISESIRKEYFNALYNSQNGNNEPMKRFKFSYPKEYDLINGVYHKRIKLRQCIAAMKDVSSDSVYWGCLTFDEKSDKNLITTKRKQAQKHLNEVFDLWVMVEEFGEDNGRYHIHFIGVFKVGKSFDDFFKWKDREQIEKVVSEKRISRYLCDYMSKQVPRVRRSKNLIKVCDLYNKARSWRNHHFESLALDKEIQAKQLMFLLSVGE